ncbi:MAG: hypothetical protein JSR48_06085 [Verrucomicrobia bacterium]|nr:hypothetical protein [Verrucomicrobiota bacterium]
MKESKFIELLNLYVDHEITPEEAALLEAEVRRNPERRQVYRQYCQMQKACSQLGHAFKSDAPEPLTAPNVVALKPRRSFGLAAYAGALGAVAACVAAVLYVRSTSIPAAAPVPAAVAVAPAPAVPPAGTQVASVMAQRPALQPVVGPRVLALREPASDTVELAPAAYQVAFGDWMNDVRLSAVDAALLEDLRFDGRSTSPTGDRTIRTVRPFQGKVEMAAVRFQK